MEMNVLRRLFEGTGHGSDVWIKIILKV